MRSSKDVPGSGKTWRYRPLVLASLAVNHAVAGPNRDGYAVANIALHTTVSLVLACLARSLGATIAVSGVAGLLFALHPVHSECVNTVVGRAETLCAVFFLLALLLHRRIPAYPKQGPLLRVLCGGCF